MKKTNVIFLSLVFIIVAAFIFIWSKTRVDKAQVLTDLLKINHLPEGYKFTKFHYDQLPDTVVKAELIIPKGSVTNLLSGLPFEQHKSNTWIIVYQNAHFIVLTDESGEKVEVECAVE